MNELDTEAVAVKAIAAAIENLVDDMSACEDVILDAMCVAMGQRVAAGADDHQGAQNGVAVMAPQMAYATAYAMSKKLDRGR